MKTLELAKLQDDYFVVLLKDHDTITDSLEISAPEDYNCSVRTAILEAFEITDADVDDRNLEKIVVDIYKTFRI